MYLSASNKEKVLVLAPFHPVLFDKISRDLKNEHLKKDPAFYKKYFGSPVLGKIPLETLIQAYVKAVHEEESAEAIAEHILQRWMLKEPEIYTFYEKQLSTLSSDFTTLASLEPDVEKSLIDLSEKEFGALRSYLFAVINSVCFSEETFHRLEKGAKEEFFTRGEKAKQDEELSQEKKSLSTLSSQIERLQDRHEKKIQALERKYFLDTEGLKKQIAKLQQRLALCERK